MERTFNKENSLVIKGFAILAMLFHHCFLKGRFEDYAISLVPFTQGQITNMASFLKICVPLFAFVSGYGLWLSLDSKPQSVSYPQWYKKRIVSSFKHYWLIVVLVWIICMAIDQRPVDVYFDKGVGVGIFYMLADLAGVSSLLDTPMLIGTWWYMGAAFAFIILAPLLHYALKKVGSLFCLAILFIFPRIGAIGFPGGTQFFTFMPAFCLGMIFAKNFVFEHIRKVALRKWYTYVIALLICAAVAFALYKTYLKLPIKEYWDIKWDLIPTAFIVILYLITEPIGWLKKGVAFLGKHSANIFMIHTLIRGIYLEKFIYTSPHFTVVLLKLFVLSLAASFVLNGLIKLTRYDLLIDRIFFGTKKEKPLPANPPAA